jgi:hypothetical protein
VKGTSWKTPENNINSHTIGKVYGLDLSGLGQRILVSARIRADSMFKRFLCFVVIDVKYLRVPQVENLVIDVKCLLPLGVQVPQVENHWVTLSGTALSIWGRVGTAVHFMVKHPVQTVTCALYSFLGSEQQSCVRYRTYLIEFRGSIVTPRCLDRGGSGRIIRRTSRKQPDAWHSTRLCTPKEMGGCAG